MKQCPRCGNKKFNVTAHVCQDWLVDENGEYLETIEDCSQVAHYPDNQDLWECSQCGYSDMGEAFECASVISTPETASEPGTKKAGPAFRNISLVDENGNVLGAGAISCDGDPREKEAIIELCRQVERSGIKAKLEFSTSESFNLDTIGDLMKQYQDSADFFEALFAYDDDEGAE